MTDWPYLISIFHIQFVVSLDMVNCYVISFNWTSKSNSIDIYSIWGVKGLVRKPYDMKDLFIFSGVLYYLDTRIKFSTDNF